MILADNETQASETEGTEACWRNEAKTSKAKRIEVY
jgi:hypothetical protein